MRVTHTGHFSHTQASKDEAEQCIKFILLSSHSFSSVVCPHFKFVYIEARNSPHSHAARDLWHGGNTEMLLYKYIFAALAYTKSAVFVQTVHCSN